MTFRNAALSLFSAESFSDGGLFVVTFPASSWLIIDLSLDFENRLRKDDLVGSFEAELASQLCTLAVVSGRASSLCFVSAGSGTSA